MYCFRCGNKIDEGFKFCPSCGTDVSENLSNLNEVDNNMGVKENSEEQNTDKYSKNYYNYNNGFKTDSPVYNAGGVPNTGYDFTNQKSGVRYAGFWIRFVASAIDGAVLSFVYFILNMAIIMPIIQSMADKMSNNMDVMNALEQLSYVSDQELIFDNIKIIMDNGGSDFIGVMVLISVVYTIMTWLYFALMESSNLGATLGKLIVGIKVTDTEGQRITFLKATGRYFGKIISAILLYIGFIMAGVTQKKQALHDIMAGCLVVRK